MIHQYSPQAKAIIEHSSQRLFTQILSTFYMNGLSILGLDFLLFYKKGEPVDTLLTN